MNPHEKYPHENALRINRRHFFGRSSAGIGTVGLTSMLGNLATAQENENTTAHKTAAGLDQLHFPARAKRVIYLCQSGAPSQHDLFDYKPLLNKKNGEEIPAHVRGTQQLTNMSAFQSSLPLAGTAFKFKQHGQAGMWISELMPKTAEIVDECCFVRSMYTEAINHVPAIAFFLTGSQIAGRPSLGSWLSYGLGSENKNLPGFVVLVSAGQSGQPLYSRLWGNGFLDSRHQGVRLRSGKDPVLYLSNPEGITRNSRREMLDTFSKLNRIQRERELDPEIESRVQQYELAFRMQMSVPEVADLSDETEETFELYGAGSKTPGTYAANCLLARKLIERDVRFVQLFHQGWDQHSDLPSKIKGQARETDQASAALVKDLKRRGLLDDTLVIWGGEFGRTCYSQGKLTTNNYGRDHHPRCFTIWMAGGGIKPGYVHGNTDAYGYNIADEHGEPLEKLPSKHHFDPRAVHVHDLQATLLKLLGIDHKRLIFKHQGRRFRLTDVHGHVIEDLIG